MSEITIQQYEVLYQEQVLDLILSIQQQEFGVAITKEDQPDLAKIEEVYQQGSGNFWVAVHEGKVVGTISLVNIRNDEVALKKMFVDSEFRGAPHRTGQHLLNTALEWAKQHGTATIFLGTTPQFKAAHRFYEKNGFEQIAENELPGAFPLVAVDKLFYRMQL
ncbi:GNAT family N-acetyltransferase [Solibacillus sp. FSL H8-0538]|uniref:GNAT family N-acetyltransferase n=1 Tax=Solibacillus sp. FSL H8-0538 TaxID=2921400 RepID=UPI0030F77DBA